MNYIIDTDEKSRWDQARLRNLTINLAKVLINQNEQGKKIFSRQELVHSFSFKESDFKYLAPYLFSGSEDSFTLKEEVAVFIANVISSHLQAQGKLQAAEKEYLKTYVKVRITIRFMEIRAVEPHLMNTDKSLRS